MNPVHQADPRYTLSRKRIARTDRQSLASYQRIKEEGLKPSTGIVLAALKLCTEARDLQAGKRIHKDVVESGDISTIFVANSLVNLYAKCGSLSEARQVFEQMIKRNVVSWTAIILGYAHAGEEDLALKLYSRMQDEGCKPNRVTVLAALKACTNLAEKEDWKLVEGKLLKVSSLERGMKIHAQAAKSVIVLGPFVENSLVDMYWKCGNMVEARRVFEGMVKHDTVSWNAIILGYAQTSGDEILALKMFRRMQEEGCAEDRVTLLAVLKACAKLAEKDSSLKLHCLEQGRAIHELAVKKFFGGSELFLHISLANSLVDMYSKCGSLVEARKLFEGIQQRTTVSWNCLLTGYVQAGEAKQALELYAQMQREDCQPDYVTYVAALKACGIVGALELGRFIHSQVCNAGVDDVTVVGNALVDFYGKCGSMDEAEQVFGRVLKKTLVTWTSLLAGYSSQGKIQQVFELFERMLEEVNLQPDHITFLLVLSACRHAGLVNKGYEYFSLMRSGYGIVPGVHHYTCMVDLLGQANHIEQALAMVKSMPVEADVVTWMVLLDACVKWKNVAVGELAFESIVKLDGTNASAHVLMANIYAAAGMSEEAIKVRAKLQPGLF